MQLTILILVIIIFVLQVLIIYHHIKFTLAMAELFHEGAELAKAWQKERQNKQKS